MRASVRPADDGGAAPKVDRSGLQSAAGVAGQVGQLERGGRRVFVTPADRFRGVRPRPVDEPAPAEVEPEDVGRVLVHLEVLEALDQRLAGVADADVAERRPEGPAHEPLYRVSAEGAAAASPHVDDQVMVEQFVALREFHEVHDVKDQRALEVEPLEQDDPLRRVHVDVEVLPFHRRLESLVLRLRRDGVRVAVPVGQGYVVTVAGGVLQRQVQGLGVELRRDVPHHQGQLPRHVPIEAVARRVPDPPGELGDVLGDGPAVHGHDEVSGLGGRQVRADPGHEELRVVQVGEVGKDADRRRDVGRLGNAQAAFHRVHAQVAVPARVRQLHQRVEEVFFRLGGEELRTQRPHLVERGERAGLFLDLGECLPALRLLDNLVEESPQLVDRCLERGPGRLVRRSAGRQGTDGREAQRREDGTQPGHNRAWRSGRGGFVRWPGHRSPTP